MRRRDFVRAAVSTVVAPKLLLAQNANPAPPLPAPVPWTLGLNPSTPVPQTQTADELASGEARFFTPTQMETLKRLCDILLPPLAGKPGALAAGTPVFLDFLIGSSPEQRRTLYQGGLDWLDAQSKKQFSKTFAQLASSEADQLLQPWMRSWMSDHPPTESHADFVNIAHADIRTATVNSKAWSESPADKTQELTPVSLYWFPIEPDVYGRQAPARQRASRR